MNVFNTAKIHNANENDRCLFKNCVVFLTRQRNEYFKIIKITNNKQKNS